MTTRYTGMNPDGTGNLNDMEHLKQSVRDILTTPLASRVMRREYGSLVPDLDRKSTRLNSSHVA